MHNNYPERTPIANHHLAILRKPGVERDQFGDSTGVIGNL
jgi:hypothetical protein